MESDTFCVFDLGDIFPDHTLLVNVSFFIVSLLSNELDQSDYVIAQCIITNTEMRMLLPLLDAPVCCQKEVLRAGYYCTYEFLLKVLLSPDVQTTNEWNELVRVQWEHLNLASAKNAQGTEMKGVYNALFTLRQKLEQLGLTVRSKRDGYYLCKMAK